MLILGTAEYHQIDQSFSNLDGPLQYEYHQYIRNSTGKSEGTKNLT